MAFVNLSFEDVGTSAGLAYGWTFASSSRDAYAAFDDDDDVGVIPLEGFEDGWSSNGSYAFAFQGYDVDLTRTTYNSTSILGVKLAEDFEEFWQSNQLYVFGLSAIMGTFNSTLTTYEAFDREWSSNEGYLFALGALTTATFDPSAPVAYEDFTGDWSANQSYKFAFTGVGTDLVMAVFGVSSKVVENFEETWPTVVATSI